MPTFDYDYLTRLLPDDFFDSIRAGKLKLDFYPPYSNESAWQEAGKSPYAAEIIQKAQQAVDTPVPPLLYSNYCRYLRDGNRISYQTPYFQRREALANLALALCLTRDKEKFMPALLDYAVAILEEWTWCLPAHMKYLNNGKVPGSFHPTDLFCAETGAVMAALRQILGGELDKEWVDFSKWIEKEVLERTVYNVLCQLDNPDTAHVWITTQYPQNWTIWCSCNTLFAAMICEKDTGKLEFFTRELLRQASRYASYCYKDGYCPEGPSYYHKAALMLFRTLDLLNKVVPRSAKKAFENQTIRNLFEFIANVRIGKDHLLSFADGKPYMINNFTSLMPAAAAIKSEKLLKLGSGKTSILGTCGDYLLSSLALLFDYPQDILPEGAGKDEPCTFYPGRVAILRSPQFSAALKGGNNVEAHNHLDLGHFSIYFNGQPLIVDPGTGTYTKKHFSPERYNIWYISGAGHNAPVFGEYGQAPGPAYTATLEIPQPGTVFSDLSHAYPVEAGVRKFHRTMTFQPEKVVVTDDIELDSPQTAVINLLSVETAECINETQIKIGEVILELDGLSLLKIEVMPEIEFENRPLWGRALTSIKVIGNRSTYSMIFRKA